MKVVHFTTSDKLGGAAKASFKLHEFLTLSGMDHHLLVLRKKSNDATVTEVKPSRFSKYNVRIALEINTLLLSRYFHLTEYWSLGLARGPGLGSNEFYKSSDLLSLSWVSGLLSIKEIGKIFNSGKPVVWTLYDMWAFTGGCHYSQFCSLYEKDCIACPQLAKPFFWNISHWVWKRKVKWNLENVTIVCPSQWLALCAAKSSIFRGADIRVIPTGIDLNVFSSKGKECCREFFSFSKSKSFILFVADGGLMNERKGGALLEKALLELVGTMEELPELVLLGCSTVSADISCHYKMHYPQIHNEEELAQLYAACDVTAIPSQEENLALTVLESMACGTPCVTFKIGGMSDVIRHKYNGYMADPFNVHDLCSGLAWALENEGIINISENAKRTIENEFGLEQEAEQYTKLFQEKVSENNRPEGV